MSTGLDASMVTPGSTAPDASFAVPDSVACANTVPGTTAKARNAAAIRIAPDGAILQAALLYELLDLGRRGCRAPADQIVVQIGWRKLPRGRAKQQGSGYNQHQAKEYQSDSTQNVMHECLFLS